MYKTNKKYIKYKTKYILLKKQYCGNENDKLYGSEITKCRKLIPDLQNQINILNNNIMLYR
jgi:hypothetical protein